ncbi:uncharacterized protein CLUP02_11058 [Colletotrichum lupini]|uniref:Uncharacterized protein n=1 Tax=Colletotrichum lupini TaxID=145971 RepID=A0A9Q8SXS1_9PEZI|nr:uncharacterized protein CLUP02_11058 [Colletotrichum lupini]UQC85559.1 hypothetical protein CLUP02_11058 [Colletotrichum lupini]
MPCSDSVPLNISAGLVSPPEANFSSEVGGPQEQDSTVYIVQIARGTELTELTFLVLQGSQADLRFPISTKALVAIRQAGLRFPFLCVGGSWGLPSSALKISSDACHWAFPSRIPLSAAKIESEPFSEALPERVSRTSRTVPASIPVRCVGCDPKSERGTNRHSLPSYFVTLSSFSEPMAGYALRAVPKANSMYAYPSKAGESAISPKWSLSLHIEDNHWADVCSIPAELRVVISVRILVTGMSSAVYGERSLTVGGEIVPTPFSIACSDLVST